MSSHVGENIRRLRGEKSLAALAREVGISAEAISYIERGERGGRYETIEKIAKCLGVSAADLYAEPPASAAPTARRTAKRRKAS